MDHMEIPAALLADQVMAENEYLDSSKSRRWMSVAEGLQDRCDVPELAERAREQFYKTFRKIGQEIQLADMIANINDVEKLKQICQSIEGAADVKTFLLDAAQKFDNPIAAIEDFLGSALENCLYDIPYLASDRGGNMNLSEARRQLDEVRIRLAPDIHRMAEKWHQDPTWKPQRQRNISTTVQPSVDVTKRLLGESLIAGFRS